MGTQTSRKNVISSWSNLHSNMLVNYRLSRLEESATASTQRISLREEIPIEAKWFSCTGIHDHKRSARSSCLSIMLNIMPPNKNSRVCHFSYNDHLSRASTGEPVAYQRYGIMKKKKKLNAPKNCLDKSGNALTMYFTMLQRYNSCAGPLLNNVCKNFNF